MSAVAINKHAERMADARAKARDLVIPDVFEPQRRVVCEANDRLWLKTYCADVFYNPFTAHQEKIIDDCGEALRYGTQKCKAAPRGDGKSSIVKYLALKYALCRQVRFPLILAATFAKSKKILGSLKRRLASRAPSAFTEDYPLECHVAGYVDPWPSRARNVTANGRRPIHVEWGPDWFILPTWEEEEALGPIMYSLGYTSDDLQGCNIYDQRPDFVMLDDLDSRDSLAAEDGLMAGKIEEVIDKTVAGLGGQSRRLGQFMLCTITSRESAAFKYSDPTVKPAWSGERIAAIIKWPERIDLWEQYIEKRQAGQSTLDAEGNPQDVFGRVAHQFLLDNFDEMHRGAVLSNPHNFEPDILPDGSQKHVSALQRCYDYIADKGMASFLTEHQNDPPPDENLEESGITANRIRCHLRGTDQGQIPDWAKTITAGIDVGKRALHWVVSAWGEGATGTIIDYGVAEVHAFDEDKPESIEKAIVAALLTWRDETLATEYGKANAAGERMLKTVLVDSGWYDMAVHNFVRQTGGQLFRSSKGFGQSENQTPYKAPEAHGKKVLVGSHWHMTFLEAKGVWLVGLDADYWKRWVHDRFLTSLRNEDGTPYRGSLGIYGVDDRKHMSYAKHLTAETEVEEFIKGKGLKRLWKKTNRNNHWFDATYMACAAANINGIELLQRPDPPPRRQTPFEQSQRKPIARRQLVFRR